MSRCYLALLLLWVPASGTLLGQGPLTLLPALSGGTIPTNAVGGIPLKRDLNVRSPAQLQVVDAEGKPVVAGVQLTSRWPTDEQGPGPARWATLHVPVGSSLPRGLKFVIDQNAQPAAPTWPAINTEASSSQDTELTVVLGDGNPVLIAALNRRGKESIKDLVLRLDDEEGKPHLFHPGKAAVEHHDDASIRWRFKGDFANGLKATVRITQTRNSPLLKVAVRLENPGKSLHVKAGHDVVYIKALSIESRMATPCDLAFDGESANPRPLPLRVTMDHVLRKAKDYTRGLPWTAQASDGVTQGVVHVGSVAIGNKDSGLLLGRRHAAYEGPTRIDLMPEGFSMGLLPLGGTGPHYTGNYGRPGDTKNLDKRSTKSYRIEGGLWKTFDLGFVPMAWAPKAGHPRVLSRTLETPPLVTASPHYALLECQPGILAAPFVNSPQGILHTWQRIMTVFASDQAADRVANLERIGLPQLVRRGGTNHHTDCYGWWNFGDLPWADGYCSLHYDHVRTQLGNFLSSQDRKFFDFGAIMARHQRDIDMIHSEPRTRLGGSQRYEKGWFHGNAYWPTQSHHWLTGLFLHYVMTGDPGTLETLNQSGEYLMSLQTDKWHGFYGARMVGWPLDNLTTMWLLNGDERYKQRALATIRAFERKEATQGGKGFFCNPKSLQKKPYRPAVLVSWQHAIMLSATCRYIRQTGDTAAIGLVQRMSTFLHDNCYRRSQANQPAMTLEQWAPDFQKKTSVHLNWMLCDALSRAADCLDDGKLWAAAKDLFISAVRFHGGAGKGASLNNPRTWSPVAARLLGYPNTETKILGQIGRFGMSHPYFLRIRR